MTGQRLLDGVNYIIDLLFKPLVIREFHRIWHYSNVWRERVKWLGVSVQQNPMDMWVIQEIIFERKPDYLIETGTNMGGSALYFANIFDAIGHGKVITIDIENKCKITHPRIVKILGDSISLKTELRIRDLVKGGRCIVFLDSLHNENHVLREMEIFSDFVKTGDYLIVADTNLNGHPVAYGYTEEINGKNYYGSPYEAVKKFLKVNPDFVVDKSKEKFLYTEFPNGFLRRVR